MRTQLLVNVDTPDIRPGLNGELQRDIKTLAVPVLEHRLILRPEFEIEGLSVSEVIQTILQQIAVPR